MNQLHLALGNPIWLDHKIGDLYKIIGDDDAWKIAYYPIFENGKTKVEYDEPRVLVEKKITNGIDFREMPLKFLTKITPTNTAKKVKKKR